MGEICLGCGRSRRSGEWSCPACAGEDYGSRLEGERELVPPAERGPLLGVLGQLLELRRGDVCLLLGPKGIGKTTIALQAFPEPWFCTNEMGPGTVRRYARRLGVQLAGISQSAIIDADPAVPSPTFSLDLPEPPPADVILDSLTESGDPLLAMGACKDLAETHGARVLALSQITSDGTARGGPRLEHLADVVVHLGILEGVRELAVVKNRGGALGSLLYELGPDGARLPTRDGYYTVEGHFPRFRLVRHPDPRARYAGLYLAAERSVSTGEPLPFRLPDPPLATAASSSRLYPGGFVEPEDAAARRSFARDNGVPYFFPT